jgi:small subunit ribosomal protein S5
MADFRNSKNKRGGRGQRQERKYDRQVVTIRRVAKVTSGGRRLRFSAMVVVGDHKGSVGVGLGRGVDTRSAIDKGARVAEKSMKKIQLIGDTIPHEMVHKKGAARVMIRPAKLGTGVIAGSSVRTVLEVAGIENVYAKILGSNELVANTYCVFEALTKLRSARVLKRMDKMRERVGIKVEMDKERKIAAKRKWEKEIKEGKRDANGRPNRPNNKFGGGRNDRFNKNKPANKPAPKKTEVKETKPEVKVEPKVEAPKTEVKTDTKTVKIPAEKVEKK